MKHLALFLSLIAAPAAADSICDIPPDRWEARLAPLLTGHWDVENGPGIGQFGTLVRPLPAEPVQHAEVLPADDGLGLGMMLVNPEGTLFYDVTFKTDERWNFGGAPDSPFADLAQRSPADIALLAGNNCSIDDLPRVLMQTETMIDGTRMETTIRLFMVSETMLVGAGAWSMQPDGVWMEGRRVMTMTRPDGY